MERALHELVENFRENVASQGYYESPEELRESIYDNTLAWIRSEAEDILEQDFRKLSYPGVISEDTLSTAIATFTTSLLPAVRRIYASLIAMDLVSVQPYQL